MAKRQIFYSFHFKNDVMRVQQVRNIGTFDGNAPVSHQDWETVKKGGDKAIEKWINDNMNKRSCVVVLIGEETSKRPWVEYEIKKAWSENRGLLGIYVHNLSCPNNGKGNKGASPFDKFNFKDSNGNVVTIPCKNPKVGDAYNDIKDNIEDWIQEAIALVK
ncbi:MAG: TIR domain-containing protein [Burkholderiaceae bacterium]